MLFDIQVEQGVLDASDLSDLETNYIPTHSHLMGAWVWGGHSWGYVLVLHSLVDRQGHDSSRRSPPPACSYLRFTR